jgi:formylglycine-generating enzyme required for sulfatase activity
LALPAIAADGVVELTTSLPTLAVGKPLGVPVRLAPTPGKPAPGFAGSFAGARRVDCADPAPPGRVCIPGGAFWIGAGDVSGGSHERIAVVPPFYLDAYEVTVRDMRSVASALFDPPETNPTDLCAYDGSSSTFPFPFCGDPATNTCCGTPSASTCGVCVYTAAPSSADDLPMNCVSYETARDYCVQLGGNLPTEAQLEYVLGGLTSARYVWGDAEPGCADAVYALGPTIAAGWTATDSGSAPVVNAGECNRPGQPTAALPAHRVNHGRDALVTPSGGVVLDLAGNVSEYARDVWQPDYGSCWRDPGVYEDPVCEDIGQQHRAAGGDWLSPSTMMRAAARVPVSLACSELAPNTGFRCVFPAKAKN